MGDLTLLTEPHTTYLWVDGSEVIVLKQLYKKLHVLKKHYSCVLCKYINGTRGIISLFLAMIMAPFLSISLLLVESARYQHAMEIMNELMDSAALSTEANYDTYLNSRFGLLAFDQKKNPTDTYNKYMEENTPLLSNSVSLANVNAEGVYALSDTEVFKNQILEFSEVSVGIEATTELLNVSDWMKKLYKKMNVEKLNEYATGVIKVAGAADAAANLIRCVETAIEDYNGKKNAFGEQEKGYEDIIHNYHSYAETFKEATNEYIQKESQYSREKEAADNYIPEYDEETGVEISVRPSISIDLSSYRRRAERARDNYCSAANRLSEKLSQMKRDYQAIWNAVNAIPSSINDVDSFLGKEGMDQEDKFTSRVVDEVTNVMKKYVEQTTLDDMTSTAVKLAEQAGDIDKVRYGSPSDGRKSGYTYITSDSSISSSTFKSKFDSLNVDYYFYNTVQELTGVVNRSNNSADKAAEKNPKLLELLDLLGQMMGLHLVYDGALDSVVISDYHVESFYSTNLIGSIANVTDAGKTFLNSYKEKNPIKRLYNRLKSLGKFLLGVSRLLIGIVSWVGTVLVNLALFDVSPKNIYETFFLYCYGIYNCPSRTTYTSSGIASYSYKSLFNSLGGDTTKPCSGALSDLDKLTIDRHGSDKAFKGAEVEYLLEGGVNELQNQAVAFLNVYLVRLVLNLNLILTSSEVKAQALAANIAGWVVYLVYILAEPLVDTFLLVNGQDEYLFKSKMHLSIVGSLALAEQIANMTNMSKGSKAAVKDWFSAHYGHGSMSGTYKMNYNEHLLILMLATVNKDQYLQRLQNIVTMESRIKNDAFSLEESYTCLKGSVGYNLNSMFSIDNLSGPFRVNITRYGGY